MKTSTKYLLAGVIVAVSAGGAFAAKGMRDHAGFGFGKEMFKKADTDQDGSVSMEEMMVVLTTRFDAADTDGDAVVTKAEIITAVEENFSRASRGSGSIADRFVWRFDLDNDGAIAKAELENRARKVFALADFNDDGKVEMAEIRRMAPGHKGRHGFHKARWDRDSRHRGGRWWHEQRGPRAEAPESAPAPESDN